MNSALLTGKRGDIAALVAGATLPLSLAPFEYFWLAPFPVLLLIAVTHPFADQCLPSVRRLFFRYFCFGVGYFAIGASWVYVSIHGVSE